MTPQNKKMLIGAVISAALAIAVYYGLIGQQQANSIQTQANQTLGTTPAGQQTGMPTTPIPNATTNTTTSPAAPVPAAPAPPAAPSPQH